MMGAGYTQYLVETQQTDTEKLADYSNFSKKNRSITFSNHASELLSTEIKIAEVPKIHVTEQKHVSHSNVN